MNRKFFARDPEDVARELLGCELVHEKDAEVRGRIVETEAYGGAGDPASHAFHGETDRNAPMFEEAGKAYVYLSYGIHHLLNAVTGDVGEPGAVLIRAVEPLECLDVMRENRGKSEPEELCSGPGKLTQAFGVTQDHNRADILASPLRLEDGNSPESIVADTRIGISQGTDLELRFYEEGNRFISR